MSDYLDLSGASIRFEHVQPLEVASIHAIYNVPIFPHDTCAEWGTLPVTPRVHRRLAAGMCDTLSDRVHDADGAILESWVHREGAEVVVHVELVYFAALGGNELVGLNNGVGAFRFAYGLGI
jgi:hypothetical protein